MTQQKVTTGETVEVLEKHQFDAGKLERYMDEHVEGFEGPMDVGQFAGGQSCPTYRIKARSGEYVMRRKPPGKLLPSAHAVDREFRIIKGLNQTDFPVPKAYVHCADESVTGTEFFIMSFVPGRVFWDPTMPDLTPAERAAAYDSMNEVLAKLHSYDYMALGLENHGRPGNYFVRQISRWSKQYVASETETIEEMNKLMDWLPESNPTTDETTLVHGDYSPHNILFHPTEPKVAAVLDWEISTLGHPLGDLTYLCQNWYAPPAKVGRPNFAGRDLEVLGIPSLRDYIDTYCARVGRTPPTDEELHWYKAYNLFRSAAIAQGIIGRVRDGTANDPNAAATAGRIIPTAQAAWVEAQKAGAG